MKFFPIALSTFAIASLVVPPSIARPLDLPIAATIYKSGRIIKDDRSAWFTGEHALYFVRWSDGRMTRIEHSGGDVYVGDSGDQERVILQEGKGFYRYLASQQFKLCIAPRKIGG